MSTTMGATPYLFNCPQCGEIIDVSAETCSFCGTPVDRPVAVHRAVIFAKVNRACSEATYIRSCALALPLFFVVCCIPHLGILGFLGLVGLSLAIPVWAAIWWARFSALESNDSDYTKSRKAVKIAGIAASLVLLLLVFAPFLFGFLLGILRAVHATSSIQ